MTEHIKYREGYKYQLAEEYRVKTDIIGYNIDADFLQLTPVGVLIIKKGYAWDGPSGPTFDTSDFMRGSLVHDALYQLMRLGIIPESYRRYADELLKKICLEDGMWEFRADYVFHAVDLFAASAARTGTERPVIIAP